MIICVMSSQHRDKPLNVRPPTDDRERAQAALQSRDKDMTSFVTAFLRAVATDPDATLAFLAKFWPEPKPRGRPPKTGEN
jgi:hypothetical protein